MKRYINLCSGVTLDKTTCEVRYSKPILEPVLKMFEMRSKGFSYKEIADELNIGSRFKIRDTLANEYYIGYYEKKINGGKIEENN